MKITKHRQKILDALQEWFRIHKEGPTLEELCQELGMQPSQKATLQRWLQTMRGIDVEWEDHAARSLRLLRSEPEEPPMQIPVQETLRYLATGVVEWEKQEPVKRAHPPEALRIGMSRMYLTSLLRGEEENTPANLPEFFDWAKQPITNWKSTQEIKNISPDVTLIEDGLVSDFATLWQVSGKDVAAQVQEAALKDVLEYCRGHQLEDAYREFRKLIITKPTLEYKEYRKLLSSPQLRPLRELLSGLDIYVDMVKLASENTYHLCPRCKYVQRRRADDTYSCRNAWCERLCAKLKLAPLRSITKEEAEDWKAVTPGVHLYGTLPGIWEIKLAEELTKLGVRVTLWPNVDEFDLLVELSRKVRWAIDVKDWSCLDEERLQKVKHRPDATETFVVFPHEREESLRIKVVREQFEPELGGVRLMLFSEIIAKAKEIRENKNHA
ncbi:Fis family transcriptional regulator [Microcoleus sp. FACHB-831]|uniref:restriction endonuclease-related protein n=1 Tax=Microcoleus sp. FACHB-831 TaxID=2692827 RepID=UPI001689A2C6|nr:Fis family transcriptional regulator [Microcoleus sp. FACHB-831]MBD1922943.1 Fis family transcriptional regulator [Microcoleus sp. FACHB-831]